MASSNRIAIILTLLEIHIFQFYLSTPMSTPMSLLCPLMMYSTVGVEGWNQRTVGTKASKTPRNVGETSKCKMWYWEDVGMWIGIFATNRQLVHCGRTGTAP